MWKTTPDTATRSSARCIAWIKQGNILKTWDPYFIDIEESGLISPWGATNLERGFPHPEEPLFLDSVFRKGWQGLPVETR